MRRQCAAAVCGGSVRRQCAAAAAAAAAALEGIRFIICWTIVCYYITFKKDVSFLCGHVIRGKIGGS